MPTYEYRCTSCGEEFIKLRSMQENVSTHSCTNCEQVATQIFKEMPAVDTYFEGSYKNRNPVPMTTRTNW